MLFYFFLNYGVQIPPPLLVHRNHTEKAADGDGAC